MVIAVAAVRVMEVPIDEVVDVVAVRHRRVATARAVRVVLRVTATCVRGRAVGGVLRVDSELALVDVTVVGVVEVAVVEVVDVIAVTNGGVPAAGAVDVIVRVVRAVGHRVGPFFRGGASST